MPKKFRPAYLLTSGVGGALDSISVADLEDLDTTIVSTDGILYVYTFDADSTNAEDSPKFIRPDDYVSQGVHVLQSIHFNNIYAVAGAEFGPVTPGIQATSDFGIGPAWDKILFGGEDAFSRKMLWHNLANSVLHLGSSDTDGMPTNVTSEGILCWGANIDGNHSPGEAGYARIKPDRFGLYSDAPAYTGYLFRIDLSSNNFYLRKNDGTKTFDFDRLLGNLVITGDKKANSFTLSSTAEGAVGSLDTKIAREVHTLSAGATSDTTTISIPSGSIILGASFNVNTVVVDDAGDDTWSAAFITGDASTLATGAAPTLNTKIDNLLVPVKTTDTTQIRFTANGGNFSAGVIETQVYYRSLTSLANV